MSNILIIEDDRVLNRGVTFALKKDGHNVISAYSKKEGMQVIYRYTRRFSIPSTAGSMYL